MKTEIVISHYLSKELGEVKIFFKISIFVFLYLRGLFDVENDYQEFTTEYTELTEKTRYFATDLHGFTRIKLREKQQELFDADYAGFR